MEFEPLLDCIYTVAADGRGWEEILTATNAFVGSEFGALIAPRLWGTADSYRFKDDFDIHLLQEVDPHLASWAAALVSAGELEEPYSAKFAAYLRGDFRRPAISSRATAADEMMRTPYWGEYLRPAGIGDVGALVLDTPTDSAWPVLNLYKRPRAGAFSNDQVRRLAAVAPHLQRAARLSRRQGVFAEARNGSGGMLESVRHGCVVFSSTGAVLQANAAARAMSPVGGLHLRGVELRASDAAADRRLSAAIQLATKGVGYRARVASEVSVPGGGGPTMVTVAPLGVANLFSSEGLAAKAIAHIITPDDGNGRSGSERVQRLFRLTDAEAQILGDLARGQSPIRVAEARKRSIETVRTQIKHLHAKTETASTHELLALARRYETP